ncbi:Uncharacterised protein [Halioglobus japonicus]|nr:Uncharacterised protein [Halioglobus japonicus]
MFKVYLVLVITLAAYVAACSNNNNDSNRQVVTDVPQQPQEPQEPVDPTKDWVPIDSSAYKAAQQSFLDQVIADGRGATWGSLAHLHEGLAPAADAFDRELARMRGREDTADFALPGLVTILAKYKDSELLTSEQFQAIEDEVINFKYWPDELNPVAGTTDARNMVMWTENHYILFASGAYIAGQLYPERVFPASGNTGREMMAIYKPRILRWLELRYRSGFSEWLSNVYYDEDMPALLALIDLADDQELVDKSRIVLDLLMADMALNNYEGNFGATHGRSYARRMNGKQDSTRGAMHLAFGLHTRHTANPTAVMMAVSDKYVVPAVLQNIAADVSQPAMENRQRVGINLEEAADWGLDPTSLDDAMLLLTMEPYTHPLFIDTFIELLSEYNWWDLRDFQPFSDARELLEDDAIRAFAASEFEWDITRNYRPEANLYTYRTPSYMLSTAQDWRKGFGGDQSSIWQATLGLEAVAFTTHPGSEKTSGSTPNYWEGSGTLPRSVQVKNVVVSLYDVDTREGVVVANQPLYTHAYLPRGKFDETVKDGNWFFARSGDAYLALWSSDPDADWLPNADRTIGDGEDYDIVAQGEKTVWICELGDVEAYGDFESFKTAISSAPLTANIATLDVSYDSPSQGNIDMGWSGPVLNNGVEVQLEGYGRYENPWSQSAFPADDISFSYGDRHLQLNFDAGTRYVN